MVDFSFIVCLLVHRGFPDSNILAVFSLRPSSLGQCLYTKRFGPNAISVSISPRSNYVMVGLASKRVSLLMVSPALMVAQVYRLTSPGAGEASMTHETDLIHPSRAREGEPRAHVSVNSGRFLPGVGEGLVYGTNKGDLHLCRPGPRNIQDKTWTMTTSPSHRRHNRIAHDQRQSLTTGTQTTSCSIRCTVSTQTTRM